MDSIYSRILNKLYDQIKKAKSRKSQQGMNTTKEEYQMEVLTEARQKYNKSIDKLIE